MNITKRNSNGGNALRLFAAMAFLASATLSATTLVYEGFDIPPGDIDNTAGRTSFGWKRLVIPPDTVIPFPWYAWDQGNNVFYHSVSSGSVSYPGLPSVGNAFEFTDDNPPEGINYYDVTRDLSNIYNYSSTGQVWFSVVVEPKITGDPFGYGYFQVCLSAVDNPGNEVYLGISNDEDQSVWSGGGERLYMLNDQGEVQDGMKWAYSEIPVIDGTSAFLVMHLDFDNKTASFYVNPPVDAEDPGEPVANFQMLLDMGFTKARLRILNNGPSVEGEGADYIGTRIDDIRLGDTYQSVAAGADMTDPGGGEIDITPPVITGPSGEPGDATSEASIEETILVKVVDMLADETVAWSISGGADGDLFSINANTGGLSFGTFPDYENPQDANADNIYVVEVTATDSSGNASSQTISVTVLDIPDWARWETDVQGWVDTNAEDDLFLGVIFTGFSPWIWSESLQKYLYIEEDMVDADGGWAYALLDMESPTAQTWAYWTPNGSGWADTGTGFLGMLNVAVEPFVYSDALQHFLYLPPANVEADGSWLYIPWTH